MNSARSGTLRSIVSSTTFLRLYLLDRPEGLKISEVKDRACSPSIDVGEPNPSGVPLHRLSRIREDYGLSLLAVRPRVANVI